MLNLSGLSSIINSFDMTKMADIAQRVLAVLICLTFHELSHGFVALRLGDPTAKQMGRLSLNPLHHLDFFGTLMMILVGFGWAKPVPIDMRYFKNPKRGMAATALAGPISNFLLAFVALLIVAIIMPFTYNNGVYSVFEFLIMLASLSLGLGLFNLIPIPPLDGSKILFALLPDRVYYSILKYERYSMIVLVAGLYLGWFDVPLYAAHSFVFDLVWQAASFFPNLLAG